MLQAFIYLFLILLAISTVITLLAMTAPFALFALKAGLMPVPKDVRSGYWDPGSVLMWAVTVAGGMTILGFFGAFWVGLMVLNGWPEGLQAYTARYGAERCSYLD